MPEKELEIQETRNVDLANKLMLSQDYRQPGLYNGLYQFIPMKKKHYCDKCKEEIKR